MLSLYIFPTKEMYPMKTRGQSLLGPPWWSGVVHSPRHIILILSQILYRYLKTIICQWHDYFIPGIFQHSYNFTRWCRKTCIKWTYPMPPIYIVGCTICVPHILFKKSVEALEIIFNIVSPPKYTFKFVTPKTFSRALLIITSSPQTPKCRTQRFLYWV